jgi:hypothetical protein
LYRVLGRVNDRSKANSCNNGTVPASDSGGNPKSSDDGDSEDEGGLIPDIIQDDNNLVDDDAESSDDDVVDKTVEEVQQVLVKVPAFNPLHTEEARKLKLLSSSRSPKFLKDSIAWRASYSLIFKAR